MFDVIVIGGGVVGAAVADRLSRLKLSVALLEKGDDVAVGASRANSGIVHAGYDCEPGTLKAKFNVRGNELMWEDARELDVPCVKCGSLVAAGADGLSALKALKVKADKNGVNARILDRAQTLEIEPNVSDKTEYSLYAPEGGVVSPYQLTIAYADRAVLNGAAVCTETEVTDITDAEFGYEIKTSKGVFEAKLVVNCAGANAAAINDLAGAEHFETQFRRGDYFVIDNAERKNVSAVIFPLPTAAGKGILIAPTADGNVIYGPTSVPEATCDTATHAAAFDEIRKNVPLNYSRAAFNKIIRTYAGVRAVVGDDFIVRPSALKKNFIMAAGICSPGLTSAPAIAEYISGEVQKAFGCDFKENYIVSPERKPRFCELDANEINALAKEDERWGRIVCRCEKVTEAEIVAAIHSPVPAVTVDAVKRRVRAGMGRCQGGFCSVRVMEILSRELSIPLTEVRKGAVGSEIAVCAIKEVGRD